MQDAEGYCDYCSQAEIDQDKLDLTLSCVVGELVQVAEFGGERCSGAKTKGWNMQVWVQKHGIWGLMMLAYVDYYLILFASFCFQLFVGRVVQLLLWDPFMSRELWNTFGSFVTMENVYIIYIYIIIYIYGICGPTYSASSKLHASQKFGSRRS